MEAIPEVMLHQSGWEETPVEEDSEVVGPPPTPAMESEGQAEEQRPEAEMAHRPEEAKPTEVEVVDLTGPEAVYHEGRAVVTVESAWAEEIHRNSGLFSLLSHREDSRVER